VGDDDRKHAAVLAAACTPHSSGIHGLEFFFVTSQALSCGAIYFAEVCGKSVTVAFADALSEFSTAGGSASQAAWRYWPRCARPAKIKEAAN
jgi:hypothetical protein